MKPLKSKVNMVESGRDKALQANYELGNYDIRSCNRCGYAIEEYKNISSGLCQECLDEITPD